MRRMPILALLVALAGCLSFSVGLSAQTKPTQQAKPTTQTFIDLENRWNDAKVRKDTVALAAILADGFVSTDEQGRLSDKASILARLKSGGRRNFQSIELSNVRVHVYGDAAVVTGINSTTGTLDGKPEALKMAFTDTFIRQNGVWRAVATHDSEVR